ncbi:MULTISPECIES: ATPase, T2SS/T4P/T4SS family [unclassified Achromobacter]|uniref:ATPase, T2SS/T4P/T4SS family n=1 Tax=unclassified Achromobacter TaxID=2626865 RepID=UPI000B51C260|nr:MULTISPECIES: ATPase, T2SS/T4P/T4SS family [unclassified Achromobacter]OWT77190.1 secretion protein [Achromobacter sp. HZ28]OWT78071.1 secretion protein [Achromobacter sp. HZ34]
MLELDLHFDDGANRLVRLDPPVLVGRGSHCNVRIRHWRVGREHARLSVVAMGIMIDDLGSLAGTLVNGQRIAQHGPLEPSDEILVGPCLMRVRLLDHPVAAAATPPPEMGGAVHPIAAVGRQLDEVAKDDAEQDKRGDQAALEMLPHRQRLHAALLDALDLRRRDVARMSDAMLRSEAQRLLEELVRDDTRLPRHADRRALLRQVLDEAVGLGPLSPLLEDPTISEIMVNRHDEIYIESRGRLMRHRAVFSSEQAVLGVIERIVAPIGRRIDESAPMVDARLPDGSRVNAVVAPIALKGACLTIRKFPRHELTMEDLQRIGSLDGAMTQFLTLCVREKVNLVVAGGTGSGKTTLLNILSNAIPADERIVTIEDAAELRLHHAHLVGLEARPANQEGRGRIEIRDLVRNALRMRPDRIVVGECRGAEAFDMLAAMNTGHEGSMTTLHANSPRDALARLETMILMAGMDLPLAAVREHIASSIHIIVQQARLADGRRVITSITEITGMESGCIQTQEIFRFDRSGPGYFQGCALAPRLVERLREEGRGPQACLFDRRSARPAPGAAERSA